MAQLIKGRDEDGDQEEEGEKLGHGKFEIARDSESDGEKWEGGSDRQKEEKCVHLENSRDIGRKKEEVSVGVA